MSQIQSLLESSAQGWKNLQSDAAKLANKWEKTGLLEGLKKSTKYIVWIEPFSDAGIRSGMVIPVETDSSKK